MSAHHNDNWDLRANETTGELIEILHGLVADGHLDRASADEQIAHLIATKDAPYSPIDLWDLLDELPLEAQIPVLKLPGYVLRTFALRLRTGENAETLAEMLGTTHDVVWNHLDVSMAALRGH